MVLFTTVGAGFGGATVESRDVDAVTGQLHHLVLPQFDGLPGVLDEGGHIGGEEVFPLPHTHDERGVAACPDDDPGAVCVHRQERERTLEAAHDGPHGVGEVAGAVELAPDELCRHLGVGLGVELHPFCEQLALERVEVLDDAVVDQCEATALAAPVRVRVDVRGTSVGGPAGVADAGARRSEGVRVQRGPKVLQLAGALLGVDAVLGDEGDARRVVAPVLQACEPLHDHGLSLVVRVRSDVTDDSTHGPQRSAWAGAGPHTQQ